MLVLVFILTAFIGCGEDAKLDKPLFLATDQTWASKVKTKATFEIADAKEKNFEITLDTPFSEGLVLQRRAVNVLTGKTTQKNIAAVVDGTAYYGAVKDGRFEIYLPAMEAGGPFDVTVIGESAKRIIPNVYVGEVVLIAGQSNAVWTMEQCEAGVKDFINTADSQTIRMFKVPIRRSDVPVDRVYSAWQAADASSILSFPTIGYLYALELQKELNVPIGLICSATGGSSLAHWLPEKDFKELSKKQEVYSEPNTIRGACEGYNAMIAPILKMRFKHVLWYQGEENAVHNPDGYDVELETLVKAWRREFDNPWMGFNVIELPRFSQNQFEGWAKIRASQQRAAKKIDGVCITTCIDLGDLKDIHPKDKRVEAFRAVKATLAAFNGGKALSYPTVKQIVYDKNKVIITLETNGIPVLLSNNGVGFEVYSKEHGWHIAKNVTLNGNAITLEGRGMISGVRYGIQMTFEESEYMENPKAQLSVFNEEGLPLDQFWEKNEK